MASNHPRCDFCEFKCAITPGKSGHCGIRYNDGGIIKTRNFGKAVALSVDPVEKKPLYHVMPGSETLSVALFGCNFTCRFCQNATISQAEFSHRPALMDLPPAELAVRMRHQHLPSVSYTYSEPTVWQDYLLAAAVDVKKAGGRNFMVSNGYFSLEALHRFDGLIDAYNLDMKGTDQFYQDFCGGRLEPILRNITLLCAKPAVVVEVCTMLIEGIHQLPEIVELGQRLADTGLQVWHLSRFFPAWKMPDQPPTTETFLASALALVREKVPIPHIYAGNSSQNQDSHCPTCQTVIISRPGGRRGQNLCRAGACPKCGRQQYLML